MGVSADVVPGAKTTFSFSVVAPKKAGNYNFQWRMVQGATWFGGASTNLVVNVTSVSATPSPTPTVTPTPTPTPAPTATPSATPTLGRATVYIAHLRAQSAGSTGSGTAILKLSEDETFATGVKLSD